MKDGPKQKDWEKNAINDDFDSKIGVKVTPVNYKENEELKGEFSNNNFWNNNEQKVDDIDYDALLNELDN